MTQPSSSAMPNGLSPEGQLLWASRLGSSAQLSAALARQPNLNILDDLGMTPLMLALARGERSDSRARTKAILACKPDLEFRAEPSGQTALHWALNLRNGELAMELLTAGASPDAADNDGTTCLMLAFKHSVALELLRGLVQRSADVNRQGPDGSALHICAKSNSISMAASLLSRGADIDARGTAMDSAPLHLAAIHGSLHMIELLLGRGAAVDARDKDGRTPLMNAAQTGDDHALDLLARHGAELAARDDDGLTATDHAMAFGQPGAWEWLSQREAQAQAAALDAAIGPGSTSAAGRPRMPRRP